MRKVILLIGLLACSGVWAETRERGAICYELNAIGKVINKNSCLSTYQYSDTSSDAIVTYKIKNDTYKILNDTETMWFNAVKNGKRYNQVPFKSYVRDKDFKKTDNWNNYTYYCYETKIIHFCEK